MTLLDLLPFVAVALAFWLLILRPAKVRRDTQARLVASLAPGQRVMTAGGIFGTIRSVSDGRVRLEVAPGVTIDMVAQAIAEVLPQPDAGPGPDEPTTPTTGETDRG
jgi:preprotein translocase subunit YajC